MPKSVKNYLNNSQNHFRSVNWTSASQKLPEMFSGTVNVGNLLPDQLRKWYKLVLFRGTAHLDPLLSTGFGALSASSYLFNIFLFSFKCWFWRLSASFGAGFAEKKKMKKMKKKIKLSRKGSPSCALKQESPPANQTKERAKTKSSWISPIFVNSGVFP